MQIDPQRIAVVIGKNGSVKKELEKKFETRIDIDSKTGNVKLVAQDSLNIFVLRNIIKAIGQGHNPLSAFLLEDDFYVIDEVDIKDFVSKDKIRKYKGRVIGQKGSVRRAVQEITSCDMVINETVVSFIGTFENCQVLREALEMLLKGCSHAKFYGYLERNKKSIY